MYECSKRKSNTYTQNEVSLMKENILVIKGGPFKFRYAHPFSHLQIEVAKSIYSKLFC